MPFRVLAIDDNPSDLFIYQQALKDGSACCEFLGIGSSVISTVREWQPQLVLLDWHLPMHDGPSVLRQLKSEAALEPNVPIVVLTGSLDPGLVEQALNSGATDCYQKPTEYQETMEMLCDLVRRWDPLHRGS